MEISVTLSGLEAGRAFTCSLASFSGLLSLGVGIDMTCYALDIVCGGTFETGGRDFCSDSLFCVLDIFGL
jgi:hypothetical protein